MTLIIATVCHPRSSVHPEQSDDATPEFMYYPPAITYPLSCDVSVVFCISHTNIQNGGASDNGVECPLGLLHPP